MQSEDGSRIRVLHQSRGDAGEDRADQVSSHRVVDDEDQIRIEEGQRVRIETVQQRVQRQGDQQPDGDSQPSHGAYLTTSFGILRVCSTITSSMLPKSTDGLTAMFLKSSCPFSAFTTVPTGMPFG